MAQTNNVHARCNLEQKKKHNFIYLGFKREAYQSQKEVPWAMILLPIPLLCKLIQYLLELIKRNGCFLRNPSHLSKHRK